MPLPLPNADAWADFLLRRGAELRRGGVLSIGVDGYSAVLAPSEPEVEDAGDDAVSSRVDEEPVNPWENGASYPTGRAPSLEVDDELPDIPQFGDR